MKNLLMSLLLFNAINAEVFVEKSNCRDGSYAYKVGSIEQDDERVEIGLTASFGLISDHLGSIWDTSNLDINKNTRQINIYLNFNRNECIEIEGGFSCEANAGNSLVLYDRIFIGRYINDLGGTLSPISEIRAQYMQVTFIHGHMTALIRNNLGSFTKIEVEMNICENDGVWGHGTHFGTAFFPQRLKDHLSRINLPV